MNRHRACHRAPVALACTAFLVLASSSAGQPEEMPAEKVPVGARTALSSGDLADVLDQATATQRLLEQVAAVFVVTQQRNIDTIPEDVKEERPIWLYNDGVVTGTWVWLRSGTRQRFEQRFDVPEKLQQHDFAPMVFVDDGERQIHHYPSTSGGLGPTTIVPSGNISSRVPADLLFPIFRRDFGSLREDFDVSFEGFSESDGRFLIRFTKSIGPDKAISVDSWVSPSLDYAVVHWRCEAWGIATDIDYERNAEGLVVPMKAVMKSFGPDGQETARLTLEAESMVIGPPDPDALDFDFEPGMMVLDNRRNADGKMQGYLVQPDGTLEEADSIEWIDPSSPTTRARTIGFGAVAVLGVVLALGIRAYMTHARRHDVA